MTRDCLRIGAERSTSCPPDGVLAKDNPGWLNGRDRPTPAIAVASAQRVFGPAGAQWVAMLGGLFDLHGVSLATAVLLRESHLALEAAGRAIGLAILASFLSKFGIRWFLGRRADFALRVSAELAAMLAAGTGVGADAALTAASMNVRGLVPHKQRHRKAGEHVGQ
jgi:hypothetical protein